MERRLLDGVTPAARYLPLDPIDFEARYWVPHSGWPITFDQMAPYYDRARMLCGIGSFDFHGPLPESGRAPLSSPSGALLTRLDQIGPATAFTRRPLVELTKSDRVHVVTNATAVELTSADGADDGMATTSVRTHGGLPFTIRSRLWLWRGERSRTLAFSSTLRLSAPRVSGTTSTTSDDSSWITPECLSVAGRSLPRDRPEPWTCTNRTIVDGQVVLGKLKLSETVLRREELLNGNAEIIFSHYLPVPYYSRSRSGRA